MQSRMDCKIGREYYVWSKHSSELSGFDKDNNSHKKKKRIIITIRENEYTNFFLFPFSRQASVIHSQLEDDQQERKKKPNDQKTAALCICLLNI